MLGRIVILFAEYTLVAAQDNWVVFRSEVPDPADIQQGGLGDCYFLSALACIAQRPALIRKLFVGPTAPDLVGKLSEHGVYQARTATVDSTYKCKL